MRRGKLPSGAARHAAAVITPRSAPARGPSCNGAFTAACWIDLVRAAVEVGCPVMFYPAA